MYWMGIPFPLGMAIGGALRTKGWTLPPKTQTGLIFLNWVWCAIFWAVTRINLVEVPGDPVGVSKVQVGREGGSSKEGLRLPSHLRRRD